MGKAKGDIILRGSGLPTAHKESLEELKEKIRQMEEKNKRLGDENKHLEEKTDDIEEENKILRDILKSKNLEFESILQERNKLQRQVKMNSTNSSKPPSTDGLRKPPPKSRREKTGMKRGGQKGHKGCTIVIPHNPDEEVDHYPTECTICPHFDQCRKSNFVCVESRHVIDIRFITKVTKHKVYRPEHCKCSEDTESITGQFPDGVDAHAQYGQNTEMFATLLNVDGAVSFSRTSTMMKNLFGTSISASTVKSMITRTAKRMKPVLELIKTGVISSKVANFDETGVRVAGGLNWIHSSSTRELTYMTVDSKRGEEGIKNNGVMPSFEGIAVHDCWSPYWKFSPA